MKNYCVYPIKLIIALLLGTTLFACGQENTEPLEVIKPENRQIQLPENFNSPITANESIMQINQQMGKIAYELMAIDNKDSYFFSPVSLYLALAVFRPGSTDIAYKELNQKLIPSGMSEDEFNQGLKQIISELSGQKNFALKNKSLVIIDDHQEFSENYIEDSTQLGADLIAMDFLNKATTSTKRLNQWVAQEEL